ncbi:glycosyltransferase family 39 protein [Mycobacterium sp. NAZ190054]|uniref:ArnT family glycosyltransferase n=1 Tax=Mycobacterium sp. NAZ190054 TaxID=1747766 RepID=UPI0009E9D805|nr:glycosyltransferase family 39 protein [Mycobacterium sp. NAZ190054]
MTSPPRWRWFDVRRIWPLCALSSAVFGVLMALATRYGFHRDEFYIRESGRRLDWGYPDHPPLSPSLAAITDAVAPDSLIALRVIPALAAAATVLLVGLIAREFGGEHSGQILAGAAAATSIPVLSTGHILATVSLDVLFAAALTFVIARLLRTGDHRLWAVAGVVLGIGMLNRVFLALYAVALLVAVIACGPREPLRSRWFPIGAAVALAIASPTLMWQAANGWPQWEMATAISAANSRWELVAIQLVIVGPLLLPVWIAGAVWLIRRPELRCFGIAFAVLLTVLLISSGQPHYLFTAYPALLAAGGAALADWLQGRRVRVVAATGLLTASAVASGFIALPLVTPSVLRDSALLEINSELGEQIGWPEMGRTVAAAIDTLPAARRADTVVIADNYGQAGALDHYGGRYVAPGTDFPPVYSGHQAYAWWGPPPEHYTTAIVMGTDTPSTIPLWAQTACGQLDEIAVVHNDHGVPNQEHGTRVFLCSELTASWSELWPQIRRIGPARQPGQSR